MTVVFHTHLALDYPDQIAAFAKKHPQHRIVSVFGRQDLFDAVADADVLVEHRITQELLNAAPKLKWIFIPYTGVNMVPWDLLEKHGIRVSNNHGNASTVAERAMALALALMGRIPEFDRGLRRGYWFRNESRGEPFQFWRSLSGKKVCILGTGAIGGALARMAAPFTKDIIGFRRDGSRPVPLGFRRITTDLHDALKGSSLCFVGLPLTQATEGLIGEEEIKLLRDGFLVNVSRGQIVQEGPLYRALTQGGLSGAALDVWQQYPEPFHAHCMPSEYAFHELDNVVLSPHAGSHAVEGKLGQLKGLLMNLQALFVEGLPKDVADASIGY